MAYRDIDIDVDIDRGLVSNPRGRRIVKKGACMEVNPGSGMADGFRVIPESKIKLIKNVFFFVYIF